MTKQEIFDEFYLNFVTKKRKKNTPCRAGLPSFTKYDGAYKYPGCAIGCLTAFQEIYEPEMEGNTITRLLVDFPKAGKLFEGIPGSFLYELQDLHDNEECWTLRGTLRISNVKRFMDEWDLELPRI